MERDAVLAVRIPAEVKEAVRRAGEADHGRSLSGMVVRILREWCVEKGYLAPEANIEAPKRRGKRG
ncbi:MAG TPA: hypothetical protein VFA20_29530 [Myxococcaceae bacterium]|nr:hypothetical protein [Myxococcaceae bacterium]